MSPQEASGSNPLPDHVHAMMADDRAEILRLRAEVERLMGTREEWLEQAATNWAPARLLFVEGQLTTVVMDAARLADERDSALAEVERLTAERAGWVARACNAEARRCDGCSEPNRCGNECPAVVTALPSRADILADITRYLSGSSEGGGDRAYFVWQTRLGMGLVITATDVDSLVHSYWDLVLTPRINAPKET